MRNIVLAVCGAIAFFNTQAQDNSFKKYEQSLPGSSVKFAMVPVPSGTFLLGSPASDSNKEGDETPQKEVKIEAFWMGAKEVTFEEFLTFFADEHFSRNSKVDAITRPSVPYVDPSAAVGGDDQTYPAINVKQFSALMYCRWLYKKTGTFYRLPSEAEWEYAARAGSKAIYPFGDDASLLDEYAWYSANSNDSLKHGGLKKPNAWGLYDMLGNAQEWVLDQYQENYYATISDKAVNPIRIPEVKHPGVVRGGSYMSDAGDLRPANRIASSLDWSKSDPQIPKSQWWNTDAPFVGFRIIRPLKQPTAEEADKFFKQFTGR
ncbi:MAG TPA: SUMF1/EgtB/PvdO family nonheme iron enzyme [Niabella sp.]|nr:SUMF1/EgtB/PvdO family nonheme iron enzyme [Niabella sp.]